MYQMLNKGTKKSCSVWGGMQWLGDEWAGLPNSARESDNFTWFWSYSFVSAEVTSREAFCWPCSLSNAEHLWKLCNSEAVTVTCGRDGGFWSKTKAQVPESWYPVLEKARKSSMLLLNNLVTKKKLPKQDVHTQRQTQDLTFTRSQLHPLLHWPFPKMFSNHRYPK